MHTVWVDTCETVTVRIIGTILPCCVKASAAFSPTVHQHTRKLHVHLQIHKDTQLERTMLRPQSALWTLNTLFRILCSFSKTENIYIYFLKVFSHASSLMRQCFKLKPQQVISTCHRDSSVSFNTSRFDFTGYVLLTAVGHLIAVKTCRLLGLSCTRS